MKMLPFHGELGDQPFWVYEVLRICEIAAVEVEELRKRYEQSQSNADILRQKALEERRPKRAKH